MVDKICCSVDFVEAVGARHSSNKFGSALVVAALTLSRLLALGIAQTSLALLSLLQRCAVAVLQFSRGVSILYNYLYIYIYYNIYKYSINY